LKNAILAAVFVLLARAADASDFDSVFAATAVGWNGTTTELVTKDQLAGWLDNGVIDELRAFPPAQSDTGPVENGGFGTASASAEQRTISLGFMKGSLRGLGASAFAQGTFTHPANSETIAESYGYLKDTLSSSLDTSINVGNIGNSGLVEQLLATYSIDGKIVLSGDARVELGVVVRLTDALGDQFTAANTWSFSDGRTHFFGLVGGSIGDDFQNSLDLTVAGPTQVPVLLQANSGFNPNFITVESFLYLRAQVGVGGGTGTANADFSHTMQMSNIQFFDDTGQVIPGVQLAGVNGDVYPYNVVPEPSTLALVGVGSIGLLFARFCRMQRR
jgi:hypothetical protein